MKLVERILFKISFYSFTLMGVLFIGMLFYPSEYVGWMLVWFGIWIPIGIWFASL